MSYFIVDNEGDMDRTLSYAVEVARNGATKNIDVTFSSDGMMVIFMDNLVKEFILNKIPKNNGLHLNMSVPEI
jgi:hypothetical protein